MDCGCVLKYSEILKKRKKKRDEKIHKLSNVRFKRFEKCIAIRIKYVPFLCTRLQRFYLILENDSFSCPAISKIDEIPRARQNIHEPALKGSLFFIFSPNFYPPSSTLTNLNVKLTKRQICKHFSPKCCQIMLFL